MPARLLIGRRNRCVRCRAPAPLRSSTAVAGFGEGVWWNWIGPKSVPPPDRPAPYTRGKNGNNGNDGGNGGGGAAEAAKTPGNPHSGHSCHSGQVDELPAPDPTLPTTWFGRHPDGKADPGGTVPPGWPLPPHATHWRQPGMADWVPIGGPPS
jgi:hypothetical protein